MVALGTSLIIAPVKGSNQESFSISSPNSSILKASLSESAGYTSIVSPLTLKVALLKSRSFLVYCRDENLLNKSL